MIFTKQNQRLLMSNYNKARKAANEGATFNGRKLEIGRVNRAFGILQHNEYEREYILRGWTDTCNCPDAIYNPQYICKHQIAAMIEEKIFREEEAIAYQLKNFEYIKTQWVQQEFNFEAAQNKRQTVAEILEDLGY